MWYQGTLRLRTTGFGEGNERNALQDTYSIFSAGQIFWEGQLPFKNVRKGMGEAKRNKSRTHGMVQMCPGERIINAFGKQNNLLRVKRENNETLPENMADW